MEESAETNSVHFDPTPVLQTVRSQSRAAMRTLRRSFSTEERLASSVSGCDRLVAELALLGATRVAFYSPIDGELDPTPAAQALRYSGGASFLPRMDESAQCLTFVEITDSSAFETTKLGTLEAVGKGVMSEELDAIVVPGVAFDRTGNRIGFGQGWYDRTLGSPNSAPTTLGFCFDEQIVESIEAQTWDKSVQMIVTPSATIICTD